MAAILLTLGALTPAAGDPIAIGAFDCEGPAPAAEPGTDAWRERDAANMYCAEQRHHDKLAHPVVALPAPGNSNDAYREPTRHNNVRFRFTSGTTAPNGNLTVEVYRPCSQGTCASNLDTFEPPYPTILVLPGGAARKELYWWGSQPLAESGYLVAAISPSATIPSMTDVTNALTWLLGPSFPFADEIDRDRLGITGHSTGGALTSYFGQADARLSAAVEWDRGPNFPLPPVRTPELFITGDYGCQVVPVCQPTPRSEMPSNRVDGPWDSANANPDFEKLRAAGVDSMKISIRSALHLDWVPSELAGNRYTESVTVYYTLAWFDRYLKGKVTGTEPPAEQEARRGIARDAFARLTATSFDDSADVHNISQGFWDPAKAVASGDPLYGGNVPYEIAGMPVADRLSFYFFSRCFITEPGTDARFESNDMREEGCHR